MGRNLRVELIEKHGNSTREKFIAKAFQSRRAVRIRTVERLIGTILSHVASAIVIDEWGLTVKHFNLLKYCLYMRTIRR